MQFFINEVTKEQLEDILNHMEHCAKLAERAGIDCIEVHGDRLVGSLCSKILNQRNDEYACSWQTSARRLNVSTCSSLNSFGVGEAVALGATSPMKIP